MTAVAEDIRAEKLREDKQIADTILRQMGFTNWMALDVNNGFTFIEDKGVSLRNVVVGYRKRGMIDITLTPADLYNIKVSRFTMSRGTEVLHEWEDIDVETLPRLLNSLWA